MAISPHSGLVYFEPAQIHRLVVKIHIKAMSNDKREQENIEHCSNIPPTHHTVLDFKSPQCFVLI